MFPPIRSRCCCCCHPQPRLNGALEPQQEPTAGVNLPPQNLREDVPILVSLPGIHRVFPASEYILPNLRTARADIENRIRVYTQAGLRELFHWKLFYWPQRTLIEQG